MTQTRCLRCTGLVVQEYDEEPKCLMCGWRRYPPVTDMRPDAPNCRRRYPPVTDMRPDAPNCRGLTRRKMFARMWSLAGMTQTDIARSLGIDRSAVARYLRGPL